MPNNGFKLRGLSGDVDRVSVQSTLASSFLLTRRRWRFMPARWELLEISRDELMVLKCNDGEAVIEVKHLGGPHGALICDEQGKLTPLKDGSVQRFELKRNVALFVKTQEMRYPR